MHTCLKLSDAAVIGLHAIDYLARNTERLVQNREIADKLGVSSNHLAKVHQRLVRAGLLQAVRGPGGGFKLSQPANEISLLSVVIAIENEFQPSRCLLGRTTCIRETCILGRLAEQVNEKVESYLTQTTAADLAR